MNKKDFIVASHKITDLKAEEVMLVVNNLLENHNLDLIGYYPIIARDVKIVPKQVPVQNGKTKSKRATSAKKASNGNESKGKGNKVNKKAK